jgi:hypothetical protein
MLKARSTDGIERRRVCKNKHAYFTIEIIDRKAQRPPKKEKPPKIPKPPRPLKIESPAYSPALEQWSLKVTKESPDWLKAVALKLG